jgi:TonB-dependent SusC/RagA subfamily outer membrane receptor
VAAYGIAAKNGVILVSTKSGIDEIINHKHESNSSDQLHGQVSGISIRGKNKNAATFSLSGQSDAKSKPLYILDGKEMTEDEAKDINPDRIESIEVLKDSSAVTLHGDKGKNGVIIIKTKNSKKN